MALSVKSSIECYLRRMSTAANSLGAVNETGGRLSDVRRRAVRADVEARALELFLERGYDATTVDDIATAVGTSRRTVFRYFATKEDLVLASMKERGDELAGTIRATAQDAGAWTTITTALLGFAAELDAGAPASRLRARMLAQTPSLHAALALKHLQWQETLTAAVLPRVAGGGTTRTLRAQALVAAALACLDVAVTAWALGHDGPGARARLRTAFDAVAAVGPASTAPSVDRAGPTGPLA